MRPRRRRRFALELALVCAGLLGPCLAAPARASDDGKSGPKFTTLNRVAQIDRALPQAQLGQAPAEAAKQAGNQQWDAAAPGGQPGVGGDTKPQLLRRQQAEGGPLAPDDELDAHVTAQPAPQTTSAPVKVTPWSGLMDKAQGLVRRAGQFIFTSSILSYVGKKLTHYAWTAAAGAAMIASAMGLAGAAAAMAGAATLLGGMILTKHGQKLQGAIITLSAAALTYGAVRAVQGDRRAYAETHGKISAIASQRQALQASYLKPHFFARVWNGFETVARPLHMLVQGTELLAPGLEQFKAFNARFPLLRFVGDLGGGWVGASDLIDPATNLGPHGGAGVEPKLGKDCLVLKWGCTEGYTPPGTTYKPVNLPLFGTNGPQASDINQGWLGDCYFEAAMAELARQNPNAVKNMIHDNGDGTYSVTFYRPRNFWEFWEPKYVPTVVTVDNKFPVDKYGNPIYDRSPALWDMILEKAYAKYRSGNYGTIGYGGDSAQAMTALTGVGSREQNTRLTSINELAAWDTQKQAITAATKSKLPSNDPLAAMIVPSHVYYVESVDPVHGTVTLGNPWGTYTGALVLTMAQFQLYFGTVYVNPTH